MDVRINSFYTEVYGDEYYIEWENDNPGVVIALPIDKINDRKAAEYAFEVLVDWEDKSPKEIYQEVVDEVGSWW